MGEKWPWDGVLRCLDLLPFVSAIALLSSSSFGLIPGSGLGFCWASKLAKAGCGPGCPSEVGRPAKRAMLEGRPPGPPGPPSNPGGRPAGPGGRPVAAEAWICIRRAKSGRWVCCNKKLIQWICCLERVGTTKKFHSSRLHSNGVFWRGFPPRWSLNYFDTKQP